MGHKASKQLSIGALIIRIGLYNKKGTTKLVLVLIKASILDQVISHTVLVDRFANPKNPTRSAWICRFSTPCRSSLARVSFRKLVPYLGVLIIRLLLYRVLIIFSVPYFWF